MIENVNVNTTPLPLGKIGLLGLILAVNNTSIWMIFSFLPFMVSDFYPELSVKELGYKAGILGSSYSAGAILGNFISGFISDKYGRRPALLLGLFGTSITSISFGFSAYFWTAVLSRFCWGLINGNIGVAKTYLSEICDDTNVAKAMSYFGIVGGVGRTIGPMIGGFLSTPAKRFPVFRNSIFDSFPFALPSLIISVCCFIVFCITYFVLPETLPFKVVETIHTNTNYDRGSKVVSTAKYSALNTDEENNSIVNNNTTDKLSNLENHGDIELSSLLGDKEQQTISSFDEVNSQLSFDKSIISNTSKQQENNIETNQSNDKISLNELVSSPNCLDINKKFSHRRSISFLNLVKVKDIGTQDISFKQLKQVSSNDVPLPFIHQHTNYSLSDDCDVNDDNVSINCSIERVRYSNGSEFNESIVSSQQSYLSNIRYLLKQHQIIVSTTLYGLISFVATIISEIFPLWVVTDPEDGGFSYDAALIGLSTMICGIIAVVLQLFLYPMFIQHFGVIKLTKYATLLFAVAVILLPSIGLTNSWKHNYSSELTWGLIIIIQSLQNCGVSWALVSTFILINNSCYSHQRATVNAIGQTCASFARMIGPYLGALTFAWSENNHLKWPFNYYFAFYFLGIFSSCIYFYISFLPRSIQRRKREPNIKETEEIISQMIITPQKHSTNNSMDKLKISKHLELSDNDIELIIAS